MTEETKPATTVTVEKTAPAAPAEKVMVSQSATVSPAPPVTPAPKGPRKTKILYIIMRTFFDGTQKYVIDIAAHAKEFDVAVMLPPARDNAWEGLLPRKLAQMNIGMIFTQPLGRIQGYKKLLKPYYLYQAIRADRPDIVHIASFRNVYMVLFAARMARVPKIIFTAHGWTFQEPANFLVRILRWLGSLLIILFSDKVICVSAHDRSRFAGWFFERKLVAIKNAVEEEDFYDRDDARRDLVTHSELYESDLWVGTIAELTDTKNLELAIRAVGRVRDAGCPIFYCIVGDGPKRIELEDFIYDLKLDQNIKILGFVSDAQRYIKAFDIGLLPSRKEGLPYFLLQAAAAGVPVIASDVGGVPEIIRDGDNGLLFKSNNIEHLTSALTRLSQDQEMRVQFSKATLPVHFEDMLRETYAMYR